MISLGRLGLSNSVVLGSLDLISAASSFGFSIPLTNSTTPSRGDITTTFSRGTTASYITYSGTVGYVGVDEPRFENDGFLVEDSAENLIKYSEDFTATAWAKQTSVTITGNAAIAPDGNLTADLYNISAVTQRSIDQAISFEADTTYTFSIWIKPLKDFTLRIRTSSGGWSEEIDLLVSDGWQRVESTATFTSDITTVFGLFCLSALTGDLFYLWGGQMEVGNNPTSYTQTISVPVTRTADELRYDVEDSITQGQGSIYCEFVYKGSDTDSRVIQLSSGLSSSMIETYIDASNQLVTRVINSIIVASVVSETIVEDVIYKLCFTYEDNALYIYLNGFLVGSDTGTIVIPTDWNQLGVGQMYDNTLQLNGNIKNIRYYNEPLSTAKAKALTKSIYLQDENGNILFDENGDPIIEA